MRINSAMQNQLPTLSNNKDDKELKKACKDFEAIFFNQILKSMRKTVTKTDLFGSQKEEEIFQDMMDAEVSKTAAQQNSIGIADMLYRQLSTAFEEQESTTGSDTRGNKQ